MVRTLLAAVAVASLAFSAARAASPAPPPSFAELTAPPRLHDAAVSPGGRYVAIARRDGDRDAIAVIDLASRTQSVIAVAADADVVTLNWLRWKGDDRLVFSWSSSGGEAGLVRGGVASVGRDGTGAVDLGKGELIQALEDDPDHILLQGYDPGSLGRYIKAIRVDVRTGEKRVLDRGGGRTWGWAADRAGRLVLRYEELGGDGSLRVKGRAAKDGWRELFVVSARQIRSLPDTEILAAAPEPGKMYVATRSAEGQGDTRELRLYDFARRAMGPRLWSHPRYDFDSVVFNDRDAVAGYCFWADVHRCEFTDPAVRRDYAALTRFFGPDRSVGLGPASADGAVRVVNVSGPDDPGSVWIFDRRTAKVDLLGAQQPALHPDRLGPASRFGWTASDGAALTGYLTEPPRATAGRLPLVVMPHGGPESRDRLDYDRWAQAFATRGYLVFQPNFRGSSGFGAEFARQGRGQWGLRMQDDVMDGVRALVATGRVDPDRICIVGGSYGGYVSLYAGARRPDVFKCVVSFAGVADLTAMMKHERGLRDRARYRYWLKSIGDPATEGERLRETSPITWAADYRPPVLLIHGEDDDIVPVSQSRAMDAALREAGRSPTLVVVPGQGHSGWAPDVEADALARMVAFVDGAIGAPR
ncbi:MAG: alpha/beta hydrolase family protein [Pseudomonadota bacterium]